MWGCYVTANIIATDMAQLLPLLQDNIDLNQASDKIKAQELSWSVFQPSNFSEQSRPKCYRGEPTDLKPDIILAADCVYLEWTFPLLVDTLKNLCTPSTTVLMSYKKRRRGKTSRAAGVKDERS